jgi:flavorubredoxin
VTDDKEQAKAAIASSTAFLLGSPTILGDALRPVWEMLLDVNPVIHKGKIAGAFGSYAWSGEAVGNLIARMEQLRLKVPVPGLRIRLKPSEEQLKQAVTFGKEFAAAIREEA